jgi:hypothetical protein
VSQGPDPSIALNRRVICPNSTVPYFVTVNDTPQAAPFSSKEMASSSSRRDL